MSLQAFVAELFDRKHEPSAETAPLSPQLVTRRALERVLEKLSLRIVHNEMAQARAVAELGARVEALEAHVARSAEAKHGG